MLSSSSPTTVTSGLTVTIPFDRVVGPREPDPDLNLHGTLLFHRPVECRTTAGAILAKSWALPFRDAVFESIHCTGVLEYVRDDVAFRDELTRLLAPGGRLSVSVPHQGPLAGLDSMNLYRYLVDISKRGRKPSEIAEIGWRRRYSLGDIQSLLGGDYELVETATREIGISELVQFGAMGLSSWLLDPWRRPSGLNGSLDRLRALESRIPTGDWGSFLTFTARRK
jgi:hypothetical protein